MKAQTQTKISIQKKRPLHRFLKKKNKSHLRLVYKEDKTAISDSPVTSSSFENKSVKMVSRPKTSLNQLLAQLSPDKYAVPGIKIA